VERFGRDRMTQQVAELRALKASAAGEAPRKTEGGDREAAHTVRGGGGGDRFFDDNCGESMERARRTSIEKRAAAAESSSGGRHRHNGWLAYDEG
jgi:hypothetical protein